MANRVILSSIEGQYRTPVPLIWPEYMGERCRFARISACEAAVVLVIWQFTCEFAIEPVKYEKGSGGLSPF